MTDDLAYWRGKPVADLTHAELVAALNFLARRHEDMARRIEELHDENIQLWKRVHANERSI